MMVLVLYLFCILFSVMVVGLLFLSIPVLLSYCIFCEQMCCTCGIWMMQVKSRLTWSEGDVATDTSRSGETSVGSARPQS